MQIALVGPLIGELGGQSVATSGAVVSSGQGYDFAINDLQFKVANSDANPYQRATAQFRKDQLDTGQNPGDQSLTGWWTRGQFSFHKGAGVTYYEVEEGETVLNRYYDAEGLDPFKTPGKVICQQAWVGYAAALAAVSYVSAIGSTLVALDGSTVKYGNFAAPTSLTPSGGGTVLGLTTSPTLGYIVTTAGKIESFTTGGTQVVLYTGLTTTPRGIWYVKGRLLVNDSDGKWYQLAVNPATPPQAIAPTDVIFTGSDWSTSSIVCDTPGPILIGNSNRIFAATLDSTGTIPVFSAPVQVGELPPGETISAMAFHLGFVVIVTGAGVRIGVLSDNGQLTYGPLLVERAVGTITPPATSIARYSTRASVVIDNRIIEIDLSEQIGNGLEFAWTGRGEPYAGSETAAGVTTLNITTQIAWANNKISASGTSLLSGYLRTGFHRFATLEPKRFDSVRVTLDGTSGTCEVIRVDSAGNELSLYTIDAAVSHVEEVPLRFISSEETMALKFVLTPSVGAPTVSPVLLGYQLRALPEPARQEMIRVPLEMKDVERRQPARSAGRTGSAWLRFQALKEAEQSGAIVNYADYRIGETGRAYVESVEFTNITPPSHASTGFGGLAYVTLRKLV
jgi:hypothetical protein